MNKSGKFTAMACAVLLMSGCAMYAQNGAAEAKPESTDTAGFKDINENYNQYEVNRKAREMINDRKDDAKASRTWSKK